MKALYLARAGDDPAFELRDVDIPPLRAGHLLVRVRAAGLNPIDAKLRRRGGAMLPDPPILGCDFAGTVEAVGGGVRGFSIGDEVYGCGGGVAGCRGGSLAEYLLVNAELVAPKPASLSFREAAALPLVALTAWQGLQRAGASSGQMLLVRGGAGGVGHVVVQLAMAFGLHVTATARSPAKKARLKSLGIERVISPDAIGGQCFDIVFDAAGAGGVAALLDATRVGGHLVLISGEGAADLTGAFRRGLGVHFVFIVLPLMTGEDAAAHGDALHEIASLADAGKLRPLVDERRFGLATATDAFASVEQGAANGKIVVDIPG